MYSTNYNEKFSREVVRTGKEEAMLFRGAEKIQLKREKISAENKSRDYLTVIKKFQN